MKERVTTEELNELFNSAKTTFLNALRNGQDLDKIKKKLITEHPNESWVINQSWMDAMWIDSLS